VTPDFADHVQEIHRYAYERIRSAWPAAPISVKRLRAFLQL
jgi:hypothetical protein